MFVLKANGRPTEIFEDFYKALVEKTAREEKEKETIGYFATYYTIEKVK